MRNLWIIGNSGAARECFWLFQEMLKKSPPDVQFAGFLSWRGHKGNLKNLAHLLKGEALEMPIGPGDLFAIGIGEPYLRADVFATMKGRGADFFTLRHPFTEIHSTAEIGEANIFQMGSSVFCEARLGNANYLNGSVNISHDATVGDANFLGPFALVLGGAIAGSRNMLAVRATLLAGARIGDDNVIAPGSIVYKGCGNRRRIAGNPGIPIGKTGDE